MEETSKAGGTGKYAFAYNNAIYSDKILRLKVDPSLPALSDSRKKARLENGASTSSQLTLSVKDGVKDIRVSSIILAAESHYFIKLFTNGMKETGNEVVLVNLHSEGYSIY
ncbi:uncharacterized protein [Triticum aestivum]|uniref:BTB domain-containing protein n=1 Tax=Triticum aestivum TaxID=4565 RepID=A0A3B6B2Y1_WHEAT|nr:uncharacterized protein LOC123189757 [Triticum aestivum]